MIDNPCKTCGWERGSGPNSCAPCASLRLAQAYPVDAQPVVLVGRSLSAAMSEPMVTAPGPTATPDGSRARQASTVEALAMRLFLIGFTEQATARQIAAQWELLEDERDGCLVLAGAALQWCGKLPQVQRLRTLAARMLIAAPELGRELVEALAEIDATFSGQE